MKNLILKAVSLYLLFWVVWSFPIIVSAFTLMNNLPEQMPLILWPGIVIWLLGAITGSILFALLVRPIKVKLQSVKELTDSELQQVTRKGLNINIVSTFLFALLWLVATFILYFVLDTRFGSLASKSIWVGGIAGFLAVPLMVFGGFSLLFSRANRIFSAEMSHRKLSTKALFLGIRDKLILVTEFSLVAMAIWIGLFGYYTGINQMIEAEKESRLYQVEITAQFISARLDSTNFSVEIFKTETSKLPLADHEKIVVIDTLGNLISAPDSMAVFEYKTHNFAKFCNLYARQKISIYDNVNENVLSFYPSNKAYTLVQISNISPNTARMFDFWIWFAIFLLIGIAVAGTNSAMLATWMGYSTNNIRMLLEKIAQNNYSENATKDANDEFGIIADKYNVFIRQIRELIGVIQDMSLAVADASNQFAGMSQQISQSAGEQAASVEEISGSIEEMVSAIGQNSENAKITERIAMKAETGIIEAQEATISTLETMKDIAEKMSIIREIAAKTDLLAINAAIEASKAGDYGKGFAVVATEIRQLSINTQKATQVIFDLTKKSVQVAERAGVVLSEIMPEVQRTSSLVQEIAASSFEQNLNAEQINKAVQQFNATAQQSSSTSEQLSAGSEELAGQSRSLQETINKFDLKGETNELLSLQNEIIKNVTIAFNNMKDKNINNFEILFKEKNIPQKTAFQGIEIDLQDKSDFETF